MPELWTKSADGVNRKLRELWEKDANNVNRKLRELWAKDGSGINRKIFSGGIQWTYSLIAPGYGSATGFSDAYTLNCFIGNDEKNYDAVATFQFSNPLILHNGDSVSITGTAQRPAYMYVYQNDHTSGTNQLASIYSSLGGTLTGTYTVHNGDMSISKLIVVVTNDTTADNEMLCTVTVNSADYGTFILSNKGTS